MGRRVVYLADDAATNMDMAPGHMMRPVRVRLAHSLVRSLGLVSGFAAVLTPRPALPQELHCCHDPAYVDFLQRSEEVCRDPTACCHVDEQRLFGAAVVPGPEDDCPMFPRLWDAVSRSCGASLAGARALAAGAADVAINFAGGMHHAQQAMSSGFCYANDIAVAIHTLLAVKRRVLYVDLDVHHGDGVEALFARDPRVLTLSFHQFGHGFFPGSGSATECGAGAGIGHSVNVPLPAGASEALYVGVVTAVLARVAAAFDPEAVVLQCGADTIHGDPIGCLRVTTRGYAECAAAVLGLGAPTLILGGGGYNVFNTARCWATVAAVAAGRFDALPPEVPPCDPYRGAFKADGSLLLHSAAPRGPLRRRTPDPSLPAPWGRHRRLQRALLEGVELRMRHVLRHRLGLFHTLPLVAPADLDVAAPPLSDSDADAPM